MPDDDREIGGYDTPSGALDAPVGSPDQYDIGGGGQQPDTPSTSGSTSTGSSGSAPTRQKVDKDGLPHFDDKKSYLVKGSTLNGFKALINRNNPKVVTGGGLKIVQETPDGKFWALDVDELTIAVCINGAATTKTFYVKRTSGQ